MHHGVKGQQHGHRRYQEKDGSLTELGYYHRFGHARPGPRAVSELTDKTIKKGTDFYRIAGKDSGVGAGKSAYTWYKKEDTANIRSITPWLKAQREELGYEDDAKTMYERKYKLKDDLKIAGITKTRTAQLNALQSEENKAFREKLEDETRRQIRVELRNQKGIKAWLATEGKINKETKKLLNQIYDETSRLKLSDVDQEKANDFYGRLQFMSAGNKKFKDMYMSDLKKQGYNAIYDQAMIAAGNQSRQMAEAKEALIILDSGVLKEVGKKKLTDKDIREAEEKSSKWMDEVEAAFESMPLSERKRLSREVA